MLVLMRTKTPVSKEVSKAIVEWPLTMRDAVDRFQDARSRSRVGLSVKVAS